jgi:4-oxalocrotonate tautomerase
MPLVQVKLYDTRVNDDLAAKLIEKITDVVCELTSEEVRPYTWVLVEGIPSKQWGVAGQPG